MKVVNAHADSNQAGSLAVLNSIAPLSKDPKSLLPVKQRLLEAIVKQKPDDLEMLGQLAVVYEGQGQSERCEPLLAPHKTKLGLTEGARILGQIYAHQGKIEDAHMLLTAYTEGRLARFHQAEANFEKSIKEAEDQLVQLLRGGHAPGFAYAQYNGAGKEQQAAMVQQFISERLKDNPRIQANQKVLLKESDIVPVALDLGIVQLRRAQDMADQAARRQELERAEKTFKSVRGVAGETPQYRLHLGQVYCWLGKHTEGRKLFNEVLVDGRKTESLVAVAHILRELGEVAEARKLAEEAYEKEADLVTKQDVASLRSVMSIDLDDKIVWLGRANAQQDSVKARLNEALGQKSLEDGMNEDAVRFLREAITTYERLPENASTLNNSALVYFSLYRATGATTDLDKGLARIEKAISLQPSDSILLQNGVGTLMNAAASNIIGKQIDLAALKTQGSLGLLGYLYHDQAGHDRYRDQVRQHPGIVKSMSYLNRLIILSPKNPGIYGGLLAMHQYLEDLNGCRSLRQRIREANLDLSEEKRETRDFYEGRDDEKRLKLLKVSISENQALVDKTRKALGGVTFAVASGELLDDWLTLDLLGMPVDFDAAVALAQEAYQTAPSYATQSKLAQILLARASRDLARKEPDYAVMVKRCQRSLARSNLVACALSQPGKLRGAALAHDDVKAAIGLILDTRKRFSKSASPWQWAMLQASQSGPAALAARDVEGSEFDPIKRDLTLALSPFAPAPVLDEYWALLAVGKDVKAQELLKQSAKTGVVLPFDSKK